MWYIWVMSDGFSLLTLITDEGTFLGISRILCTSLSSVCTKQSAMHTWSCSSGGMHVAAEGCHGARSRNMEAVCYSKISSTIQNEWEMDVVLELVSCKPKKGKEFLPPRAALVAKFNRHGTLVRDGSVPQIRIWKGWLTNLGQRTKWIVTAKKWILLWPKCVS